MSKVGFFGGSFNPPINTHINLANSLIKDKILDKVIFVPVGDYYQKQNLVPAVHRYNMLKLACNNTVNLEVENIVCNEKNKLFAVDTFKLLYEKYNKNTDMYLIMGSDNFEKMPTWRNYEEIMRQYKLIIIERPKHEQNCNLSNVIYYKSEITEDITSTRIRHKLKKNEDVSKYMHRDVIEYIEANELYK